MLEVMAEDRVIETQAAINRSHRFRGESGTPVRLIFHVSIYGGSVENRTRCARHAQSV